MVKLLSLLLVVVMVAHLIRPVGWPGLKHRRDFWKIATFAMVAMFLSVVAREFLA